MSDVSRRGGGTGSFVFDCPALWQERAMNQQTSSITKGLHEWLPKGLDGFLRTPPYLFSSNRP